MITQSKRILSLSVLILTAWESILTHFICESSGMKSSFHLFFLKGYLHWTYKNRIKNIQVCVLMKIGSWSFSCMEFV